MSSTLELPLPSSALQHSLAGGQGYGLQQYKWLKHWPSG